MDIFWFSVRKKLPWEDKKSFKSAKMQTTSKDFRAKSFSSPRGCGRVTFDEGKIWHPNGEYQVFLPETLVVDFSYRVIYMTYMIYATLNSLSDSRVQSMKQAPFHQNYIHKLQATQIRTQHLPIWHSRLLKLGNTPTHLQTVRMFKNEGTRISGLILRPT